MAGSGPTKVITVSADVKQAEAELKKLTRTVDDLQEDVWDGQRALNAWKSSMDKASKVTPEMAKNLKKLNANLRDTKQKLKDAKIEQNLANKALKDAKEKATDLSGGLKVLDKATGGMVTRVKQSVQAFTGMAKGARLATIAMAAIPIVALVTALVSLTAMFKQSEEGQERWERGMAMVSASVKVAMDLFADLGDLVFKVFTGQWDELGEALDKVRDGFKNFGKDIVEEANAMNEVTRMRQEAHRVERELLVERAEANQKINDIRLEAEKRDKYTAEERVNMLKQAQRLEEEITNKEIANKERLIEAQKMEMALGKNKREDKDKLAQLEKELIDLDTKKLRGQRLLQTQITTAANQAKALKEQEIADEEALIEKKKELLQGFEDWKKLLREAEVNTQAEEFAMELENIDEKFLILQEKLLEQREAGLITDEEWFQYVSQIDQAHTDALEDADRKHKKILFDQGVKAEKDAFNEKIKIMQEEEALRQKKMGQALNFFQGMQAISELAGKKGRAFAIAAIITEQAMSVSKIISNLGIANLKAVNSVPPYQMGQPMVAMNTIMAVMNIAKGLSQARKSISNIRSKKKTPAGPPPVTQIRASLPSGATGPTNNALVEQPSFSTVGQSGTNQIAEALGQEQPPVQAYVVAQDVTTAQSLEHNIISSASIG